MTMSGVKHCVCRNDVGVKEYLRDREGNLVRVSSGKEEPLCGQGGTLPGA